jgi:hypothetical protein
MLVLDGNHQANDTGSMLETHRRIALLALALHPEAKDMLVVGLGGGATAGAASTHEGVELDVVELSSAVVRASAFFAHANHNLLKRPNVHLRVDEQLPERHQLASVDDPAEGPLGPVSGEQNDRTVEVRIAERGRGDQEPGGERHPKEAYLGSGPFFAHGPPPLARERWARAKRKCGEPRRRPRKAEPGRLEWGDRCA